MNGRHIAGKMTNIIVIPMVKDTLDVISHQNHREDTDMKRLCVIGTILVISLFNIVSLSAGTVKDLEMVISPESPIVAVLIAFLTGIISAVLFIVGTHKELTFSF